MFTYITPQRNLKKIRRRMRLARGSQAAVARELGKSPGFISDVLKGEKKSDLVLAKCEEVLARKSGGRHGA